MDLISETHRTEIAQRTAIVLSVTEPITILRERTVYNFYTLHLEKYRIPSQTACQLIRPPMKASSGEETRGPLGHALIQKPKSSQKPKYKNPNTKAQIIPWEIIPKTIVQATTCPQHSNITIPKSYISGREMLEIFLS